MGVPEIGKFSVHAVGLSAMTLLAVKIDLDVSDPLHSSPLWPVHVLYLTA